MLQQTPKHWSRGKLLVHDVMLFRPSDWTIVTIIGSDWLSKCIRHARSISVHLAGSTDMVFAVMT